MASSSTSKQESENRIADLTVISYSNLLRKDATEAALLYSACVDLGFFYLDLGGHGTETYRRTVDGLFRVAKEYFAKSLEEKLKDTKEDIDVFNICGFKAIGDLGMDSGNLEEMKNGTEGIKVPAEAYFNPGSNPELSCPDGLKDHWELFANFIPNSHAIGTTILENLSDSLGLRNGERFEIYHKPKVSSSTSAVLQRSPLEGLPANTSVGHFAHTDNGSITILFNSDWGLQVYSPVSGEWEYVAPRAGHAIVNLGDALKFMSGHKLKSCLHRVVPWYERWTSGPRFGCIYFLRPANDTKFVDSEGVEWTAGKWLKTKFESYRTPHKEQEKHSITTGVKGFSGLWGAPLGHMTAT